MKKIVSLILALAMCLSLTPAVFAADMPAEDSLIPIEENGITREEAIELLGLTEEEAKDVEFYTSSESGISTASTYGAALGYGVHDLGTFTFSGHNLGGYRTYNGTKVKIAVQYKNNISTACNLRVHFIQYGGKEFAYLYCWNTGTFQSDWIDINYGVDYLFDYYLAVTGAGREDESWPVDTTKTSATVRVVVGIYNPDHV